MAIKFGTSGWRGIVSSDFTFANLRLVAQGIAGYLIKTNQADKGIIVGYDTRFMSDKFALTVANILAQNKIKVLVTERDTPTPAIAFQILRRHTAGAVNITASHNPYEYNGVKFSSAYGGPAPEEITKEIEIEIGRAAAPEITEHKLNYFDARPQYLKQIEKMVDLKLIKKAKPKICIDCLHGTSRGYLDHIPEDIGIKPFIFNNNVNPLFDGTGPDPSEKKLSDLAKNVKKTKSRLGLATDGDADRFGIIDSDGSYVSPNHILPMVFYHLLKTRNHKGGIVRTITTTRLLDAIAKKHKREVYEVPVGFKYVGTGLDEHNALMGGEESGGMTIHGHVPEKDGILACLLVTELVANEKKSLKEIIRLIHKEYGCYYSKRVDVKTSPQQKEAILSKFREHPLTEFGGIKAAEYKDLGEDNYKMVLTDGSWIIVRPSGTEPIIRCYMETTSAKTFSHLKTSLEKSA